MKTSIFSLILVAVIATSCSKEFKSMDKPMPLQSGKSITGSDVLAVNNGKKKVTVDFTFVSDAQKINQDCRLRFTSTSTGQVYVFDMNNGLVQTNHLPSNEAYEVCLDCGMYGGGYGGCETTVDVNPNGIYYLSSANTYKCAAGFSAGLRDTYVFHNSCE